MEEDDVSAFDVAPVTKNADLNVLLAQAQELIGLEGQIEDLNGLLKKLTGRATELKTQIIPDKMAEIGLSEFATPDGHKLRVEDFVSGSLPKDVLHREKAIHELERLGGEGIIRNEITLTFEKSQHNEAMALADDLRAKGFNAVVTSGVHPQTYLAFVRECLRDGMEDNAENLGVFIGRKTKVVPVTQKKGTSKA